MSRSPDDPAVELEQILLFAGRERRSARRLALRLLVGELRAVQLGVQPVFRQQGSVRTPLDDAPVVDHQQLVGFSDRGKPVCDDE
jgi:hypothetical protein